MWVGEIMVIIIYEYSSWINTIPALSSSSIMIIIIIPPTRILPVWCIFSPLLAQSVVVQFRQDHGGVFILNA